MGTLSVRSFGEVTIKAQNLIFWGVIALAYVRIQPPRTPPKLYSVDAFPVFYPTTIYMIYA
jgi:hypothetical protein